MNSTITNFWNHFKQNNFVFLLMTEIPKEELTKHFTKLNNLLCLFNKDLDLIIKDGKNKSELIITANGNPYLFKEVELLVHYAPVLDCWKITAFLQPNQNTTKYQNGTDKPLEYYGINLKISEMYFFPLENLEKPNDLGIKVFIKNYIIHKDNPRLREAVYTHIEHLVGEKSFANDIAFIDIEQLPTNNTNGIELYNLSAYNQNLKIDEEQERKLK
ncbi:hypothetical protein [Flavobacterium psychrophilum]|uniref:hypothetical protein n=1 Tax=Flavobacterium psychrophilum TaxID=96345 RepID=UPI00090C7C9E|nr:hypothetical protein [Flavobacterium psychrophilum]EKT2072630.1 hypothetical protein [Flavobacterium psychrophilum]EKT4492143.1 hypothetical protein [Flavobacterium psychrophilum]SHH92760.1 Protein of unknown function [Flavobacterium psychrophilum]